MSGTSCQIHLCDESRQRAAEALFPIPAHPYPKANTDPDDYIASVDAHTQKYADELQARREFTGPHFKDCVECVDFLTPGWVHITLDDEHGTTYSYPAADVARVKTYRN